MPFEIIYVGCLYCNLVFRNTHTDQHCLDLIKGIAVVSGAGLCLKQNNGTNVFSACRFCGNGFLLNAATELDGVLNDTLPGGAVIHYHGELYHVFLLQFTGVHIGDNVAVLPRRRCQIQYKGWIQVVEHFHAEVRSCVVTFVHNHDWL